MEPLKITIHLKTPMVMSDMPLHLDALVAWAQTQEKLMQGADKENIRKLAEELPFERYVSPENGREVWKASVFIPSSRKFTTTIQWVRRTDPYEITDGLYNGWLKTGKNFKPDKGFKIDTGSGVLKNYRQVYPVQLIETVTAWCVGDAERIEQLLTEHVNAIGAKTGIGHGQIKRDAFGNPKIIVEPDNQALDNWMLRIMPDKPNDDFALMEAPLKPPYWDKSQAVMGYFPVLNQ